ncbi:MAG: TatD family hydrolase [Candidatus Aenigmatarchaeota archaeon]|nr:TatD family hydrolase [Candidatus Aenigmarchaeota archaeon]
MIDIHCHLSTKTFNKNYNPLVNKIEEYKKHLKAIIDSATNFEDAKHSIQLSEKYKNFVFSSLGLHPIEAINYTEKEIDEYLEFIYQNRDKIVAIGEIGLDYYWIKESEKIKKSIEVFKRFIEISKDIKKPIILHARLAIEDVFKIIVNEDVKSAVFHFFDGKIKTAKEIIKENYFISINNQVYKNPAIQNVAKEIPLEFLVTETDSPWCGIGKEINEPTNIKICLEYISKLKNISLETVEKTIDENIIRLLNLNI